MRKMKHFGRALKETEIEDILEKLVDGTISDFEDSDSSDELDDETLLCRNTEMQEEVEVPEVKPDYGEQSTEVDNRSENAPEKKERPKYRFRKVDFSPPDVTFQSEVFPPPQVDSSPYEYFKMFFTPEAFDLLAEQSNLYAHQKDGKILGTDSKEIEQLIGIFLMMGIVKMPSTKLYWSSHCRYSPIADVMSRNRFNTLKKHFHVANNVEQKPPGDPEYDKLFKVRPLLDIIRSRMEELPPEERNSVDEQIIPFKGRSSLKQYVRNKPHKWGYKCFMRAGESGIMYDFEFYVGKGTCKDVGLGFSGDIVMALTSELPDHKNFKVYFDNWFSSLQLAIALKERGIYCVGTIRNDRMGKCPLMAENDLKKKGRGSHDYRVEEHNIALIPWFDRKAINFIYTYVGVDPEDKCQRWNQSEKKTVEIDCPQVVKEYNQFMGGVDLADMLLELYRIDIRSVKWYMRIVFWCISVAVVNGWLLYRKHQKQRGEKCMYSLVQFQLEISHALTKAGKVLNRKRGRPSDSPIPEPRRRKFAPRPVDDVRYDAYGHWPQYETKKGRCKFCPSGITQLTCSKCRVNLCLTGAKNCFVQFHNK